MSEDGKEGWQPGQAPSVRDALVLLGSAVLCSALFYLWLREIGPALAHPDSLAALAGIPGMLEGVSASLRNSPPPASPR